MPVKAGDLIGFSGNDPVSWVIQGATGSLPGRGLSHIGIVAELGGDQLVYESTSFKRPPCARQKEVISGVQAHRLVDVLEFGYPVIWHYPLRSPLYVDEADRLLDFLDSQLGKPYDLAGAVKSGGAVFRALQTILGRESLSSWFCSEFNAQALVHIGRFRTRSVSRWSPNGLVRALFREGIVDNPRRMR